MAIVAPWRAPSIVESTGSPEITVVKYWEPVSQFKNFSGRSPSLPPVSRAKGVAATIASSFVSIASAQQEQATARRIEAETRSKEVDSASQKDRPPEREKTVVAWRRRPRPLQSMRIG